MTPPTPVDLATASRMPVFSSLKPGSLEVLLDKAMVSNLPAGRALFRQGDRAHEFHVVMDGWIKLSRVTPAGDEAVIDVLTGGESFVEAVTLTSSRYTATARAVTLVRAMTIPADHVMTCVREMPDLAIAMIAATSQNLDRMMRQIEQLKSHSATQRVAGFLASLAPRTTGRCKITLPYEKSLIASRLGLKPESLSREFAKLRSFGVDVRASTVEVRDMAQLCRLVPSDRTKARCSIKSKPTSAASSHLLDVEPLSALV